MCANNVEKDLSKSTATDAQLKKDLGGLALPGRSTIAHRHIIDRIEQIIESIESNLPKNPNFSFQFFGVFSAAKRRTELRL